VRGVAARSELQGASQSHCGVFPQKVRRCAESPARASGRLRRKSSVAAYSRQLMWLQLLRRSTANWIAQERAGESRVWDQCAASRSRRGRARVLAGPEQRTNCGLGVGRWRVADRCRGSAARGRGCGDVHSHAVENRTAPSACPLVGAAIASVDKSKKAVVVRGGKAERDGVVEDRAPA